MSFHHSVIHEFRDAPTALAQGRALRATVPRSSHAELRLPADRDPLGMIERSHAGRIPELVPVRVQRMSVSPFTFYRAGADVMARDLSAGVDTGIQIVICGDAHLGNFGLFASPERRLVFDMNDFDEAGIGPWDWDLKRLTVSIDLAAEERGADAAGRAEAVRRAVREYRDVLSELCSMAAVDRYFARVDADDLLPEVAGTSGRHSATFGPTLPDDDFAKMLRRAFTKARRRTSAHAVAKTAVSDEYGLRFVEDPPILMRLPLDDAGTDMVRRSFAAYLDTVRVDAALLLSQYRVVDVARRVVGVGSVGTRAMIVLLESPEGTPLVLQIKEARETVLSAFGGQPAIAVSNRDGDGHRVVASQRVLQATSDPFLGWTTGDDGVAYYWRQFRDMKGSIDTSQLTGDGVARYGELCARLLARAHAQSPNATMIAGYLGSGDVFPDAIATWTGGYGDVVRRDYDAFMRGVDAGRFPRE